MTLVDYFLPSAGQILNLFAVLAILAIFAVLGGAVSVQGRFAAADIFVGWGVVTGVFVVVGVLGPVAFTWMAFAVWGAAVPCVFLLWRQPRAFASISGRKRNTCAWSARTWPPCCPRGRS